MSEPVARQRPSIDLDDFERRLRHAQSQASEPHGFQDQPVGRHDQSIGHDDDPLTELARLVGGQPDPYGDVFAQEAVARPAVRQDVGLQAPTAPAPASPRLFGDFAAIEAGLRGTFPSHPDMHHAVEPQLYGDHDQGHYAEPQGELDWHDAPMPQSPPRTRRPVYAMIAAIAIGVVGIGVAFAYKGTGSSPRELKTIMAAAGPMKVQPPSDANATDSADAGTLGKAQDTPTKVVSREEQPVDLSQAVAENARNAAAQGRGTGASSVDVPLSPGQAQSRSAGPTASPDYSALAAGGMGVKSDPASSPSSDQAFGAGMPSPKKVKVVSVRPDGTILPSAVDSPAAAPDAPMPAAPAPAQVHPAKATKAAKSTSRVTTPKPLDLTPAADDANDATPSASKAPVPKVAKVKKPKPQRVASTEIDNQDTTDAGNAAAPEAAASGGFAVQLAAPGSEAEAKSVSSKLGAKYADALSGHRLGFRKAESNGKSVYRVRVGGLTKEDAASLCAKLKADGGACFIAKN